MALAERSAIRAAPPRAPIAWRWLLACAAVEIGLYLLTSGPLAYGYLSDEFYYLDCAERLAWGYVDHPPLSIAVLAVVRELLGASLLALRLVPTLLGVATVFLVGLLARELGGGRAAQGIAGLAALIAPVYLAVAGFYSMNAFEPALWALAALLVARLLNGAAPVTWLWLGAVLGIGCLNKLSMSWLGLGLALGMLLTPERRWLATPWPWLAGAVSLALFAPHLVWQAQNGWPTLEFMHNATTLKMMHKQPLAFAAEQLLVLSPTAVPVWIAGLVFYFASEHGRRYRLLGWIWVGVFGFLMASGTARANYSGPAYVVLLGAGSVAIEHLASARGWRALPAAIALLVGAGGLAAAPLAIPLLPPERYIAYERALGIHAPVDQRDELGPMPLHFALRFGWPQLVDSVARAYAALSPEEQAHAAILGAFFGDTGALNFLGRARGLPPAVSVHNNYWLWGPGAFDGSVVLAIAESDADLLHYFERVERVGEIDCEYCMPALSRSAVFVCRGLRRPIGEIWPELKRFI